jgi:hypothetical protein
MLAAASCWGSIPTRTPDIGNLARLGMIHRRPKDARLVNSRGVHRAGADAIRIWLSSCAGAWIPSNSRSTHAIWFNPATTSFPSSKDYEYRV